MLRKKNNLDFKLQISDFKLRNLIYNLPTTTYKLNKAGELTKY